MPPSINLYPSGELLHESYVLAALTVLTLAPLFRP